MGLFSKKPGGTFFGNLLRVGVNAAQKGLGIPPIFGQGAQLLPADSTTSAVSQMPNSMQPSIAAGAYASVPSKSDGIIDEAKKNPMLLYIAAGIAALFFLNKKR